MFVTAACLLLVNVCYCCVLVAACLLLVAACLFVAAACLLLVAACMLLLAACLFAACLLNARQHKKWWLYVWQHALLHNQTLFVRSWLSCVFSLNVRTSERQNVGTLERRNFAKLNCAVFFKPFC
jgi:hypothetical protein